MIEKTDKFSYGLALGALGVVFGDIGTSPLYALKVTLDNLTPTSSNILGVLSLIFWCLISVISLKYLVIIFRADNDGEGGILALLALMKHHNAKHIPLFISSPYWVQVCSLVMACLLLQSR